MYNNSRSSVQSNGDRPLHDSTGPVSQNDSLAPEIQKPAFVVVKLDEHPAGFGGYSDVWRARMTRADETTVTVCFSLIISLDNVRSAVRSGRPQGVASYGRPPRPAPQGN